MNELSQDRPARRLSIPLWIKVAGCMLLAFLLLMWRLSAMVEAEQHPSLNLITKWTDLKFPESAVLIGSEADAGWGDCGLYAKIEIDRSDVHSFIKSLPKSKVREDWEYAGVSDNGSAQWWNPGSVRKSKAISIHRDEDRGGFRDLRLLIGLDDPGKAVVYLECLSD